MPTPSILPIVQLILTILVPVMLGLLTWLLGQAIDSKTTIASILANMAGDRKCMEEKIEAGITRILERMDEVARRVDRLEDKRG